MSIPSCSSCSVPDPDSRTTSSTSPRRFNKQDSEAVYNLAQEQSPLGLKVKDALQVVEKAIELYSINNLALSFNGGKDCTVLIHLLASALLRTAPTTTRTTTSQSSLPPIPTIYIRQPSPFPQEESFTSLCQSRYNLELSAVEGKSMKESLRDWIEERKSRLGLEKGEIKAVLVGTRRTDPHGAKLKAFDPTDPTWPKFIRVHPILDWSYHEIWQFLRYPSLTLGGTSGGKVEWCELYDFGYTSIGSTHNTFPNPCLRQPPPPSSSTPLSSSSTTSSSSNSVSPSTSSTSTPQSTTTLLTDQVGSWLPAWELEDETQERAGREVSLKQVEKKVGELKEQREQEQVEARRIEENGNGNGNGAVLR
ncbi:hypothetical protein JCM5350_003192 [Sporobolomyces pararoseus]